MSPSEGKISVCGCTQDTEGNILHLEEKKISDTIQTTMQWRYICFEQALDSEQNLMEGGRFT